MFIAANLSPLGGGLRYVDKAGTHVEFSVVAFGIGENGEIEKVITYPKVPKNARVERHDGVSGWQPFDLEG